jgi:hydroxypyruvate isomerase
MKLSVCLNAITGKLPRVEAIQLSAKLGYSAVEFWEGKDFPIEEYKAALDETGLTLACMGGASGLVDPATRKGFLQDLGTSLVNAETLNAKAVILTTGWEELAGVSREAQRESVVEGLKEAARVAAGTGIKLLLEPLNVLIDHKGYFLYRSDEAFDILREVNSPDVKLLFDIYHQQITEGNLTNNIVPNIDLIGHFHVAGNPGRNEPYYGEINYAEVFKAADEAGYNGYAGLEYWAKADGMEDGLLKCKSLYEK